ncbi:MAG: methyltransferase domain-containing protein [Patescibacteria group bacterium]|jgi:spermidine synthase
MNVFANISLPKVIFETDSKYNGKISVIKQGESLKLSVNGVVQSMSHTSESAKRRVWGQVIPVLEEHAPGFKNILVFGLGGGTMQHFISQKFPTAAITSVEIDPAMVDVAKKYFDVEKIPNHTIITEDACRVVIAPEEYGLALDSFDVAVVDFFIGDVFPDLGTSGNFLAALSSLVKPGGLIIFNRIFLEKYQDNVNHFMQILETFLTDIQTSVIAGHTNSDNILIFGRVTR